MMAVRSTGRRALGMLVVLAAVVPYLPTIDDYFTQDDFGVVQLLASKPWTTFPRWFVMPWMEHIWGYTPDEIRPFVALTYQITAIPGEQRPELHHVFNIMLHAINAVLVMAIATTALNLRPAAAAWCAAMFALFPFQAESVAWITGRVDSMPALLYFATVLAYVRWRQVGKKRYYDAALAVFFVALFSKQNTITMVATLAAYDLLFNWSPERASNRRVWLGNLVAAWVPFAILTMGYLAMRRVLFGASVRGGIGSQQQFAAAWEFVERHFIRTVFGDVGPIAGWELAAVIAVLTGIVLFVMSERRGAATVAFSVAWWIVGTAPVLVAGYESPRHIYLASAGWAFLLGASIEGFWRISPWRRWVRPMLAAGAAALVIVTAVRLNREVKQWNAWAAVSRQAVGIVAAEAEGAPEGSLLLVGVPRESWAWATPFVLQPPYTTRDLSGRVNLVTPFRLHCCGPEQWETFTRERLRRWADAGTPVIVLRFDASGAISRLTDTDAPELVTLLRVLRETDSWQTLNGAIVTLLDETVKR